MNTEELSKKLETFFIKEGFDVRVEYASDFSYEYATSTIRYAFIIPDLSGELFLKFAMKNGLKYDCGNFFLSLFHELGHHQTLDLIDDDILEEGDEIKRSLSNKSFITDEDNYIYFNLPVERIATDWAIDYINKNKDKLHSLYNEVYPILKKIIGSQ